MRTAIAILLGALSVGTVRADVNPRVICWGDKIAVPPLNHPRLVRASGYHSCAIDQDGVKCWGDDSFGQTEVPADLPKQISMLSTCLYHTCVSIK